MHDPTKKPWYRVLYIQVLIAVFLGIVVGYVNPGLGKNLKPLGDGFVSLVKMIIAPIIFCTVVQGIASMSDLKKLGRVGLKALFYFEIVSTLALFIGLIVVNTLRPGGGFNVDPKSLNPTQLQQSQVFYTKGAFTRSRRIFAEHYPCVIFQRVRFRRYSSGASDSDPERVRYFVYGRPGLSDSHRSWHGSKSLFRDHADRGESCAGWSFRCERRSLAFGDWRLALPCPIPFPIGGSQLLGLRFQ